MVTALVVFFAATFVAGFLLGWELAHRSVLRTIEQMRLEE